MRPNTFFRASIFFRISIFIALSLFLTQCVNAESVPGKNSRQVRPSGSAPQSVKPSAVAGDKKTITHEPSGGSRPAAVNSSGKTHPTAVEVHALYTAKSILYIQLFPAKPKADFLKKVAVVKKGIEAFYNFEVRYLTPVNLPQAAFYPPRKRYRAEILLDFLKDQLPQDGTNILGITERDISTTKDNHKDWGILGLATLNGSACVVSTFRTQKKRGNQATRQQHNFRFAKTVVHEIGHNLGLEHCPNVGCLMEDAKGTVLTTDREYTLCSTCQKLLKQHRPSIVVPNPLPPWPKPSVQN